MTASLDRSASGAMRYPLERKLMDEGTLLDAWVEDDCLVLLTVDEEAVQQLVNSIPMKSLIVLSRWTAAEILTSTLLVMDAPGVDAVGTEYLSDGQHRILAWVKPGFDLDLDAPDPLNLASKGVNPEIYRCIKLLSPSSSHVGADHEC